MSMNDGKGWTCDTLKEYIDVRFKTVEHAINKTDASIYRYASHHKGMNDQIFLNTAQLAALNERDKTKKESFGSATVLTFIGISVSSMLISIVTVIFNIVTYVKH